MDRKLKPKKCKICREQYQPTKPLQQVCSPKCAYEYTKKTREKAWRKEKKEIKKQDKAWVKPKIQQRVNEIARLIDIHLPCLSTGRSGVQIHGGHVFSVKSNGNLRYNLHNIHRQSAQSNKWESHDILMRERLAEEYGVEYLDFLKEAKKSTAPKLYEKDLAKLYERACEYANLIRKIAKERNEPFGLSHRIRLRNEANKHLGIYDDDYCLYCRK